MPTSCRVMDGFLPKCTHGSGMRHNELHERHLNQHTAHGDKPGLRSELQQQRMGLEKELEEPRAAARGFAVPSLPPPPTREPVVQLTQPSLTRDATAVQSVRTQQPTPQSQASQLWMSQPLPSLQEAVEGPQVKKQAMRSSVRGSSLELEGTSKLPNACRLPQPEGVVTLDLVIGTDAGKERASPPICWGVCPLEPCNSTKCLG